MALECIALSQARAVDFQSMGRSANWYAAAAQEANVVIIDMMSLGWEGDFLRATDAGVGVMLFQGYWAPAWLNPAEAALRGRMMVAAAQSVQLPTGTTVWLDVEAVSTAVTVEAMAAWINTWATLVAAAGYEPGLYVGANQPLSGAQLYALLVGIHIYWRSLSEVPDVAHRGYAMVQTATGTLAGEAVDWDIIGRDLLGGTVHVCRRTDTVAATPEAPSPSLASRVMTLESQVTQLLNYQQDESTTMANLSKALLAAAKALPT